MRIAYFSPLNPVQSGISDYSEDLLPWLGRWADIDLYVDGYPPASLSLQAFAARDARQFARHALRYDAIIYQMGNSPAHAYMYPLLLRFPGIVVLHEAVLHHLVAWMSWDRGDARSYLNEFRFCYGAEGEALARRALSGQATIDLFDYPLSDRVIKAARRLIVHSAYVAQEVRRVRPGAPVAVVPMGVPLPAARADAYSEARAALGLAPDAFVIGSFGHINPFKRLDVALRSFRLLLNDLPRSVYVLVGSISPNYDVAQTCRLLAIQDHVRIVGYADAPTFRRYTAATDVCLNLRFPTAGETSASVLRLMGTGLPVLVSRCGTFEELPGDACIKVDVDDSEGDQITEYLRLLAADANLRRRIGENARRYVAREHSMAQAVAGYLGALRSWYPGKLPAAPRGPEPVVGFEDDEMRWSSSGEATVEIGERQAQGDAPAPDAAVLDLIAGGVDDLGLGDNDLAMREAARAWDDLRLKR